MFFSGWLVTRPFNSCTVYVYCTVHTSTSALSLRFRVLPLARGADEANVQRAVLLFVSLCDFLRWRPSQFWILHGGSVESFVHTYSVAPRADLSVMIVRL